MYFKKSVYGLLACLGILFIPAAFPASFKIHWITVFLYQAMVVIGVLGFSYYSSVIFQKKISLIIFILFLLEISIFGIFQLMHSSVSIPASVDLFFRNYSIDSYRNAPVFHPQLGRYDTDLFYTLKPGKANFQCWEYDEEFCINSQGFRDDETSLHQPEIICLGDSFTMGWGVEQESSFPQILEKTTNKKVLNIGIASYGTARELIALKKIDLQNTKTIVLQFCMNDIWENRIFIENNFHLPISSYQYYHQSVLQNQMNINYYPFKFGFELLSRFPRNVKRDYFNKSTAIEKEKLVQLKSSYVNDFFQILQLIQHEFSGNILLICLETYESEYNANPDFQQYIYNNSQSNLHLINTSHLFNKNDYFKIDGHLNSNGHAKLADDILSHLNQLSTSNSTSQTLPSKDL